MLTGRERGSVLAFTRARGGNVAMMWALMGAVLVGLVGITVDAAELEDAAGEYERQVSRAVEMDPDVQAFVEKLERTADEEEGRPDPSDLPSGDVLAREFQRFLRQRGEP